MTTINNATGVSSTNERTIVYSTGSVQHGIEEQVKKILLEKLGLEETQFTPDASFTDGLGIDSLDVFELIIEVENVFRISITAEEAEKLITPGKLIDYVKSVTHEN